MIQTLIGLWFAAHQLSVEPTAMEELHRVNLTYNSLETYKDWGEISYSLESEGAENPGESKRFNLGFSRPNRIRFEFVEPESDDAQGRRSVAWTASRGGYAIWSSWTPKVVDRTTLRKAMDLVSGMSDVSGASLKMLIPWALDGSRPTDLEHPKIAIDSANHRLCYRVSGAQEDGTEVTLWVDQSTQLIQRIRRVSSSVIDGKPANEIATIVFHPSADPHLEPADLRFIEPSSRSHSGGRRSHSRRRRHRRS